MRQVLVAGFRMATTVRTASACVGPSPAQCHVLSSDPSAELLIGLRSHEDGETNTRRGLQPAGGRGEHAEEK